MNNHSVSVYTTHQQTEQPISIRHVTAAALTGGLLTIEADVEENGCLFSSFYRFEPGKWAHFEVFAS